MSSRAPSGGRQTRTWATARRILVIRLDNIGDVV